VSSAADRQRAYKRRQRDGEAVLRVVVDEYALIDALIESGRLSEADGLDRSKVEAAAEEVLRDWVARWGDASSGQPADR
jgi:hypothetical protein